MEQDKPITVAVVKHRKGWQTSISDFKPSCDKGARNTIDVLKKLKKQLCCNGHIDEEGTMVFQGDHRKEVLKYLANVGIKPDQIMHAGTGK